MVDVLIKSLVLIREMVLKVLTLIINTFTISEFTISKVRLLNCTLRNRGRNYKSHEKKRINMTKCFCQCQKDSYRLTEGWYSKKNFDIQIEPMGFVLVLLAGRAYEKISRCL